MERTDLEQWRSKEVVRLLALVETERRYYQEIVATLPLPVAVMGPDGLIASANRAFRNLFQLRTADLRCKRMEQVLPIESLAKRIEEAQTQGSTKTALNIRVGDRNFRVTMSPIRNWEDENGIETLFTLEVGPPEPAPESVQPETVTPEAPKEGTVAEAPAAEPLAGEPPARPMPSKLPAIVWVCDSSLAFKSVTGAMELLGYSAAEWLARPDFFEQRIHPADRNGVMELFRAAIAAGGEASAEYRAFTESGDEIRCRETIRADAAGAVAGVLTDIGRRNELERQTLTAGRVEALRSMAGRLAHDLNNPLMIVTGYAEELLRTLLADSPARGDAAEILSASARISDITGQLAAFAGRSALEPSRVELTQWMTEHEAKIERAAGEAVTVTLTPDPEPAWTAVNPEQLEEVILALVSQEREGALERAHLSVAWDVGAIAESIGGQTLQPGMYARITIKDDGRGFNGGRRAALFEAVPAPHKDPKPATAMVRAYVLVREWGGDISVYSQPFRGTAFVVYLPLCEPEPAAAASEPPPPPPAIEPVAVEEAPPQQRETVLLVEDEAGIRGLVRKILQRERYRVFEAGSAEEALSMLSSLTGSIHLLLTDVVLPGMSGTELAEAMQKAVPELKVLYVSGYTPADARAGSLAVGAKFLPKPFTLSGLIDKVREALDT